MSVAKKKKLLRFAPFTFFLPRSVNKSECRSAEAGKLWFSQQYIFIYIYIYLSRYIAGPSQCNIRGDSQVLTQCYFPVLHLHQSSANYTDSFSEMWSRSFEGSRVGWGGVWGMGGRHLPIISVRAFWNYKLNCSLFLFHVLTEPVSVLRGASSRCVSFFSLHIFVSSSRLILNMIVCVRFDWHLAIGVENATPWHCGRAAERLLRLWAEAPRERHVASVLLLVDKEGEGMSSEWDLFDSCWVPVSHSDVRVPGS